MLFFFTRLISDVKECLGKMKDHSSFLKGGAQMLNNISLAHYKQRSTKGSSVSLRTSSSDSSHNSQPSYQTKAKARMVNKFANATESSSIFIRTKTES